MEYLLNWTNYPESEQSWEPRGMCDSLLDAYHNKRAEKIGEGEQQNIAGDIDYLRDNVKALGALVTKRMQTIHWRRKLGQFGSSEEARLKDEQVWIVPTDVCEWILAQMAQRIVPFRNVYQNTKNKIN